MGNQWEENSKKLKLLKSYPWLLVVIGITSLWWDFPNYQWNIIGFTIYFENILRSCSIGGIIGFLTNWVAITMLFHPYTKRPLLRQGLIPAQKQKIIKRLAITISEYLINPDTLSFHLSSVDSVSRYRIKLTNYIKNYLANPNVKKEIQTIITDYIQKMTQNQELMEQISEKISSHLQVTLEQHFLNKIAIRTYTSITQQNIKHIVQRIITQLSKQLVTEDHQIETILDKLPNYIEYHGKDIEKVMSSLIVAFTKQMNIQKIIEHNLYRLEKKKLESMIKNATMEQLIYIQYIGAILGTLGGLVIWNTLLSLLFLSIIGLLIWGLDYMINFLLEKQKKTKQASISQK